MARFQAPPSLGSGTVPAVVPVPPSPASPRQPRPPPAAKSPAPASSRGGPTTGAVRVAPTAAIPGLRRTRSAKPPVAYVSTAPICGYSCTTCPPAARLSFPARAAPAASSRSASTR